MSVILFGSLHHIFFAEGSLILVLCGWVCGNNRTYHRRRILRVAHESWVLANSLCDAVCLEVLIPKIDKTFYKYRVRPIPDYGRPRASKAANCDCLCTGNPNGVFGYHCTDRHTDKTRKFLHGSPVALSSSLPPRRTWAVKLLPGRCRPLRCAYTGARQGACRQKDKSVEMRQETGKGPNFRSYQAECGPPTEL